MNASPIVCATDLSEVSRAALRQAQALAERDGGDLHVVQVAEAPLSRARQRASGFDECPSPGAGDAVRQTCVVRNGKPVDAVVEYAHEIGARLIVVGTALPRAGVSRRESIGEMIARRVTCPTLVVPTGLQVTRADLPFRHIVCAVDFSPGSDAARDEAIRLAQSAGGALTLLHVLAELDEVPTPHPAFPEYRERRLVEAHQRLSASVPEEARHWADIDVQVLAGEAGERILSLAHRRQADLIVLGVTPRSRLSRLLLGSTSHQVTAESRCAVLVVPHQAAVRAWESQHEVQPRPEPRPARAFPPDYVAGATGRGAQGTTWRAAASR